jgi:hypothetical protein
MSKLGAQRNTAVVHQRTRSLLIVSVAHPEFVERPDSTISEVLVPGPGVITAALSVDDGAVLLQLSRGGVPAVGRITLGMTVDGVALGLRSVIRSVTRTTIEDSYHAHTGKAVGRLEYRHEQAIVGLAEPDGREWAIVVRVSHDGIAFRYRVGSAGSSQVIGAERTVLPLDSAGRVWLLDYQTWYETPRFGSDVSALAEGDYGFPALVTTDDETFVLFSESDIDGGNSGAHVRFVAHPSSFHVVTADAELTAGPDFTTPWRVAIIGDLPDIVASRLIDELAPAADAAQAIATRPGRAAWSWWSSQYSGAYFEVQKSFADFAADQGWEHLLVDCGWDPAWVPELVSHASRRGIQVHLWSSWSDLDGPEALKKLALWRSWGVAGIKVDFMESEAQERYRWYDAIIAETARVGLTVNFHGSVIPRGWARTHPQVVSYEGIRGAEYYVFYGTPLTAVHNVIQPFTRNVVGSMDYTPVTFSAPQRETSDGHELALGVVYESGITHFADSPEEYRARPIARRVLAEIAPSWDEVRLLSGHPDREAVVARRSGDRWFVGAIAAGDARTVDVDISMLCGGEMDAWVVTDSGANGGLEERVQHAVRQLSVPLIANGGFVAVLAPPGSTLERAQPRAVLDAPTVQPSLAVLEPGGTASITVTASATVRVQPGWSATAAGEGRWTISAPADAVPGSLGVVSVEREVVGLPPVVSHARILVPFGAGTTELATLPFRAARNLLGPVERNESNGGGDPHDGGPLTVAGSVHPTGIGVSADSAVGFLLGGQLSAVVGAVGVDDETPGGVASVSVLLDGETAWTATVREGDAPLSFALELDGVMELELRTQPLADVPQAHVDWLGVQVTR